MGFFLDVLPMRLQVLRDDGIRRGSAAAGKMHRMRRHGIRTAGE
ncbi:hypothetical protein NEILACOT_03539 [Neisseria lactamica ATCC 23970]|uniref:Uncharacterized protein n=1 Tax=Neisseria lactamica ATCC 23970 TaxID=546265 RepID=D0W7N9_NEILA|nr:hypothetical protein NEILACOT_03539 [Neisseria lactamica ATCC 23970]